MALALIFSISWNKVDTDSNKILLFRHDLLKFSNSNVRTQILFFCVLVKSSLLWLEKLSFYKQKMQS